MKNIIKTTAYSAVALASVAYSNVSAKVDLNTQHAEQFQQAWSTDIWETIRSFLTYILGFLWLIAVWFAIYGGFQILTAWWDDDKVKKGKTTLINALIGIFVILIAWSLVGWLIQGVSNVWSGWATGG